MVSLNVKEEQILAKGDVIAQVYLPVFAEESTQAKTRLNKFIAQLSLDKALLERNKKSAFCCLKDTRFKSVYVTSLVCLYLHCHLKLKVLLLKIFPTIDGVRLYDITLEVDNIEPKLIGLRAILNFETNIK
ncbi:hypothetical protein [Pseudoalteromonas denitrificans]|uniref:Uncharacterized protein n=1 Tax=Pseudoalteromonas denitrificans DSM 6059 TaxID=1123010 RepID=A0A1I1NNN1_9GAMM|nr:hypothetical protein [Pseudoalteromonas denitrificans]SFC99036.1 hypothetical protein SAMN02745724_03135 [Pseudoalteromonas denitrificans DSM 6059]